MGIVTRWKYCPVVVQSSPLSFMVMSLQKADAGDDADDAEVRVPRRTVGLSVANILPFTRYESSVIFKIIATFSSGRLSSAFSCLSFLLCFQHSKTEKLVNCGTLLLFHKIKY